MKPVSKPPPSGKNASPKAVQGLPGIARRFEMATTIDPLPKRKPAKRKGKKR